MTFPPRQLAPIAGMVNEKVGIFLDGRQLERQKTHFFPGGREPGGPIVPEGHRQRGTPMMSRVVPSAEGA
jgi:hypothetical protein